MIDLYKHSPILSQYFIYLECGITVVGPYSPETRQAWKELNEHFGRCPKCGIDPFVGWDAVSSHSRHFVKIKLLLTQLQTARILELSSKASELAETTKLAIDIATSEEDTLQKLSEILVDAHSDISNVTIENNKFRCKACGAIWNPEMWETSFRDLGLTAYKY